MDGPLPFLTIVAVTKFNFEGGQNYAFAFIDVVLITKDRGGLTQHLADCLATAHTS